MFSSIKEILSSLKIKISPEKEIVDSIKEFFKKKDISIAGSLKVSYQNGIVHVVGDPYVLSYTKINNQEILSYLKNKLTTYEIKEVL